MTELVKDIANELDNRFLYHKILQNLCKLTNADRASLYLVEGEKITADAPYLYDAVSNVTKSSEISQVIENNNTGTAASNQQSPGAGSGGNGIPYRIPFGMGIVGSVAKTGQTINISDAYQVC